MPTDPARVQELFLAALELHDPAARVVYLDAACGGDTGLRERIEALLRAHDTPDSLLDAPVVPSPGGDSPTRTLIPGGSPDHGTEAGEGFELGEEIGRGANGVVYRARQRGLNRVVAVKVALGMESAARQSLARFLAEAEAVASIDHPHVVRVYGFGQRDGVPFLAMEYLPGGTLADRLKGGPLDSRAAAGLIAKVASGVAAAHGQGIVHRDLKPGNVLLDESGEPKVTDFGLARRGAGSDLTRTHAVVGTPAYMAPEQASGGGKFAGPPADVWALGVILYECVAGTRPFDAESDQVLLTQITTADPPALRSRARSVPRDLDTIVAKCLSKEPEHRYPSAAELADDLGRFLRGEPIHARPVGRVERAYRWVRRKPTLAALYATTCAAAVLVGVASLVAVLWRAAEEANRTKDVALVDKDDALAGKDDALKQKDDALAAAERERKKVALFEYARTVRLAYQAWRDGDHAGAVKLLNGTRPDLRGWEWHHVRRLCNAAPLATFPFGSAGGQGDHGPTEVYWSLDGRRFAAVNHSPHPQPSDVRLVDVASGREIAKIPGARGVVEFSPDGRLLLTDSGATDPQASVRVWSAETGALVATLDGVRYARWVRGGRLLTLRTLPNRDGYYAGLQVPGGPAPKDAIKVEVFGRPGVPLFSTGTRVLRTVRIPVAGRWLGMLQVWDLDAGKALALLPGWELCGSPVAWSADGTRLLYDSDSQHRRRTYPLWDSTAGHPVATLLADYSWLGGGKYSPAFSGDGSRLVIPFMSAGARVWKIATGELLEGHPGRWEQPQPPRPGPKPKLKLGSAVGQSVTVIDAENGKVVTQLKFPWPGVTASALSPDGTLLATATKEGGENWNPGPGRFPSVGRVRLWDARTGAHLATFGDIAQIHSVAFSPQGTEVMAWATDYRAGVFDARTGQKLSELKGHLGQISQVEISPDGGRVVTAAHDNTVRVWDAATGLQLFSVPYDSFVNGRHPRFECAWGPAGPRLAVHRLGGGVSVWDGATGEELMSLPDARGVHLDPTGTRAAVVSYPGGTAVMDLRPARLELRSEGHAPALGAPVPLAPPRGSGYNLRPRALAWNPTGTRLATGGPDGVVRLWDAATGRPLPTAWRYAGAVTAVEFGPGDRLLTASMDGTAHVRDARTGATLAALTGHGGPVTSARFSPDGRRVVTTSLDGSTRVWTASGEEVRAFRPPRWGNEESPVALSAAWSPDGRCVAVGFGSPRAGYAPMAARIWEVDTGRPTATLDAGQYVAWNADGTRLLVASSAEPGPSYSIWATDSAPPRLVSGERGGGLSTSATIKIAWSPNGSRLCVPGEIVRVLDATAEVKPLEQAKGESFVLPQEHHASQYGPVSFDPSSTRLLVGGVVLDLSSKETLGKDNRFGEAVRKPACVLRHTRAWKTHEGVKDEAVWDFTQAAWSPDGKRIATAHADGAVRVWDAATGEALSVTERSHTASVQDAVWSPDGRWVLTTEWAAPPWVERGSDAPTPAVAPERSCIWDARTGLLVREFPLGEKDRKWPDGTPVAERKAVKLRNRVRTTGGFPSMDVTQQVALATTADGTRELTLGWTNSSTYGWSPTGFDPAVRDTKTGEVVAVLKGHGGTVLAAAFSPDGLRVVTWAEDATIRVWHVATGAELFVQKGGWADYVRPGGYARWWSREEDCPIDTATRYWFVSWSPDGHRLLVSAPGRGVTTLDATPLGK